MQGLPPLDLSDSYLMIIQVYRHVPKLQVPKPPHLNRTSFDANGSLNSGLKYIYKFFQTFPEYFHHPACLPSLSLALLYLTVLSFGGQMVTYLISSGFSSFVIALVRSLSVLVEITATWIAPKAMARVGPTRAAMWFASWQAIWLAGTVTFFWTEQYGLASASGLSAGVILSRIGLWGYDLCAQTIIQNVRQAKLFHPCDLRARRMLNDGRKYKSPIEVLSHLPSRLYRTFSNFCHMFLPSLPRGPINSATQCR